MAPVDPPPPALARSARLNPKQVLVRIALVCLAIRVVLEAVGLISLAAHGQPALPQWLEMWSRWDAHHYLRLAEVGYVTYSPPPNTDDPLYIVFFPLFPFLVTLVSFVLRNVTAASLVVSYVATVGALYFLHRLVSLDGDTKKAWRTVVLVLSFPTAYYLAAPYSEAVFLFGVVAAMYAARRAVWPAVAAAGALATGTRVVGIALLPALAVRALRGPRDEGVPAKVTKLAWVALAVTGLAIYLAINQIVHGDPLYFLSVQRNHWFQRLVPPWQPVIDGLRGIADGPGSTDEWFIFSGRLIAFVFAIPLLVLATRRLRLEENVYAWGGFVLIMSASWLLSLPRYLLVLYPLFVVGADLVRSERIFYPVVVAGSSMQLWFFWRYSVGEWTF